MKKTIIYFLVGFFLILAVNAARGQTVPISIEDLKELRKLAADRDFQKDRADETEKQSKAWQASSERWRGLYESEKSRADNVQGGRVSELQKANDDFKSEIVELKKANGFLHEQATRDKEQIGQLNFDVRKLKSERKYWFAGGAVLGGGGGFWLGKNFNSARESVINVLTPSARSNVFRATFAF